MAVNHGSTYVFVAKEFLDCADVVAVLEKVGGEGMEELMTRGGFEDSPRPLTLLPFP